MWKFLEKRPFFRADMSELEKYCMGGYGRIGVCRVKQVILGKTVNLNQKTWVILNGIWANPGEMPHIGHYKLMCSVLICKGSLVYW